MPIQQPGFEQLKEEVDYLRRENERISRELLKHSYDQSASLEKIARLTKSLIKTSKIKDVLEQHTFVTIIDKNGIITYVNEEFCRLTKYSKEELLGQNINILNSGYHSPSFFSHLWQTITADNVWEGELRNKAKDGSYFWAEMIITPLPDEHGRPQEYLAIRKDITRNKQAEAQMRFDTHILSHINDAVIGLDKNNLINYWNKGAEKLYELEAKQVLGKPLKAVCDYRWIGEEDEQKAMEELAQNGYCRTEIIHQLKSGKEMTVEAATTIVTNEMGEVTGLLAVIRDGTERKKNEDRLNHLLQELEKRNYELDNYVYKVSHDLRAPLTSMQGLLNLMKEETNQEIRAKYLQLIESRVAKLDKYIQSILHHSKMVNEEIKISRVNLQKLIEESFDELKHYTNWEKLQLIIQVQGDTAFYNDEFRISVVLRNIISNAIKYLNTYQEQSYLEFTISITPQKALIRAEDNGIGIEEKYLNKIFDMFFRATQSSDGSGLGLYIVKQAIDKPEGSIQVKSSQGKGTEFMIELPNLIKRQ